MKGEVVKNAKKHHLCEKTLKEQTGIRIESDPLLRLVRMDQFEFCRRIRFSTRAAQRLPLEFVVHCRRLIDRCRRRLWRDWKQRDTINVYVLDKILLVRVALIKFKLKERRRRKKRGAIHSICRVSRFDSFLSVPLKRIAMETVAPFSSRAALKRATSDRLAASPLPFHF